MVVNKNDGTEELINRMFNVYMNVLKDENVEQGEKIERAFDSFLCLVPEEEQLEYKKESLIKLLQEL